MKLANRDPSKSERDQGLYRKFQVTRCDGQSGSGRKHDGCAYFVLDLTHDPFVAVALWAYSEACRGTHPLLAANLQIQANRNHKDLGPDAVGRISDNNLGDPQISIDVLTAEVKELTEELKGYKGAHEGACKTIADMHAAAVGKVTGPRRGVVEDVIDLRARMLKLEAGIRSTQIIRGDWMRGRVFMRSAPDEAVLIVEDYGVAIQNLLKP